jgi:hypothetical protein
MRVGDLPEEVFEECGKSHFRCDNVVVAGNVRG